MSLPAPVFVGFLAKAVESRPEWLHVPAVQDICSVSECISAAPADRISFWTHNALGFYDSLGDAAAVTKDETGRYDWFAYEFYQIRAVDGRIEPDVIPAAPGSVPADFQFIGHDIVTRSSGAHVECSPLSCNRVAETVSTNEHCLIDQEDRAEQALLTISMPGFAAEPGPYYLAKVYRQTRG